MKYMIMKLTRLFIATAAFAASLTIGSAQVSFEAEPNNTIGQANPIFTGVPVSAQLLASTDVDIFFGDGNSSRGIDYRVYGPI
jgi:hypothetical protein